MKLCVVRCTVLDMECQAFGFLMQDLNIKNPGPGTIGMSYDDFTFVFIHKDWNEIKGDDCK